MKTVKNIVTGEVKRLSDEKAIVMTRGNEWLFCPKSDWKKIEKGQTIGVSAMGIGETVGISSGELNVVVAKSNPKVKKSGKNKGEVK